MCEMNENETTSFYASYDDDFTEGPDAGHIPIVECTRNT